MLLETYLNSKIDKEYLAIDSTILRKESSPSVIISISFSPFSPLTTEQIVTAVNGVGGGSKLERGSSSSDQEESLCQEDIQKLLGLQQSKVSLDKVSFPAMSSFSRFEGGSALVLVNPFNNHYPRTEEKC